jgi:hypothetical protein
VTDVAVLILHPTPAGAPGEIERWVADARAGLAERHRRGFLAAGATDATIVAGPPDERSFGSRIRAFVATRRPGGLVVLGSGAIPLATAADRRALVAVAGATGRAALANNRYSADVVAIAAAAEGLVALPDLATDNALPRWLEASAGYRVDDLRRRWRLGFDIDGPLDLALLGPRSWMPPPPAGILDRVTDRLAAVRAVAQDPRAELLVMGRMSASGLGWLERNVPARVRALVEERGMRTAVPDQRPPRSVVGALLDRLTVAGGGNPDRDGIDPDSADHLATVLAELADAAIVDSRVLLAHAFGRDEALGPSAGDRFASDLLLDERIGDDWLRGLTGSARAGSIPILLGGHSLVGPGLRIALGRGRIPWT